MSGARSGQSTLEYLLVLMAFVAMLATLGAMWHAASDGVLLGLAVDASPNGMGQGLVAALKDVLAY